MKASKSNKGKRIGTRMRGNLQQAYEARGGALAGLYHSYSLKNESDFVVVGDLLFLNFLYCEGDPDALSINYSPKHDLIAAEILRPRGVLELRRIRRADRSDSAAIVARCDEVVRQYEAQIAAGDAAYKSICLTTVTEQELIPGNEVRLQNWHRILPWYAYTRFHTLDDSSRLIHAAMDTHGCMDARHILSIVETSTAQALLMAATIKATAKGQFESNLAAKPFSLNTRFFFRGRE